MTIEQTARRSAALEALRVIPVGVAEIFFQTSVWAGLLMLAAFVVADWRMAILVVIGCAASTVAGLMFRVGRDNVRAGMQGFCGALVGAATFAANGGGWPSYPIALIAGAACAPVTWLLVRLFASQPMKRFGLPPTTGPFCLVATGMAYATTALHLASAPLSAPSSMLMAFLRSLLTNVSQVVLIDNVWAGALILIGLFVAGWKIGLAAFAGSVLSSACALLIGESSAEIAHGLAGYSGVLTMLAVAMVFLKPTAKSWLIAAIATVVTAFATLGMHQLSIPTYTWPYVITTWVCLVVVAFVPRVARSS